MREANRHWIIALAALLALGSTQCTRSHDLHPVTDAGPDAAAPRDTGPSEAGPRACPPSTGKLDLLLLVDNSGSMIEEQNSFGRQLSRLVDALASGTIVGTGGTILRTTTPVRSVQVGVVDSDLGSGAHLVPTCYRSDFGDDGILRTQGNTTFIGCSATYPSFLEFSPSDSPEYLSGELNCVASVGTSGCGFEQHLDAMLKAVTPSTSSTTFVMGTRGHGDVENAGFLRPTPCSA
ncbi:MAG: hypothetical protein GW913_00895 [Myxococcales bacterium]|nr:hypothetical protein [Myxococcales bacterium]